MTMRYLNCPQCHLPMYAVPMHGASIDRCAECGGIFLDRGELETLVRAELKSGNTPAMVPVADPVTTGVRREPAAGAASAPPVTGGERKRGFLGQLLDLK